MSDDIRLTRLRSSNSRYKQHVIDLERACKKLARERKKLVREKKNLVDENAKLKRRLRELEKVNRKK